MTRSRRDVTALVMVRHGQSTFNAARRFQGCSDQAELTPLGRATAAACLPTLRSHPFDVILVSPLQRARQTADEIVRVIRGTAAAVPPVLVEPLLREIDIPQWEGLEFTAIRTLFPEQFRCWEASPHLLEVPVGPNVAGSETVRPVGRLFEQCRSFLRSLQERYAGQRVLAVTHAGTIRALTATALGSPQDRFGLLQQSNGGVSALHFGARGRGPAEVRCLNRTSDATGLPKVKGARRGLRLVLNTGGREWPNVPPLVVPGSAVSVEHLLRGSGTGVEESEELVTAGASIREEQLREFLSGLFGLAPDAAARFHPDPGAFTVLHYAGSGKLPVLQAMNAGRRVWNSAPRTARTPTARRERTTLGLASVVQTSQA